MSTTSGIRTGVAPSRLAQGTLSGVPLAHALVYARNKRLSGVLELRASAERHAWLVFWRGLVVSSMTTPAVARFGAVVYELGFVDSATHDESAALSAATKRPQMDLLLERGAITAAQRDQVLVEQARRRVLHLFTFPPTTTFTFREGRPSSAEPPVGVDLLAPVWRALCDLPADGNAAEVLARVGEHSLRLVSDAVIERAELQPDELALCEALAKKPMTLAQLRRASDLPSDRVDRLAYLLVITRCVEVEGAKQAPLPSTAMWAVNVPRESGSELTTAAAMTERGPTRSEERIDANAPLPPPRGPLALGVVELRRRAAGLATETAFAALGLVEGASAEAARAAYFRLGRLWHPDCLPPELEEARADVERIFTHMTKAHALLTDPSARPAAVAAVASAARNAR